MEVLNAYSIDYKSLAEGSHEFSLAVDGALFRQFENEEVLGGEFAVGIELQKSKTMLLLDFKITGEAVVECDRCLDECAIAVDYAGRLTVKFSDEISDYDGEVMWISPSESELDLSQYIYESILLSLPFRRVHAEGQCNPDMEARFTVATAEQIDRMEEQAAEHNVGAENIERLAALKAQMEQAAEQEEQ